MKTKHLEFIQQVLNRMNSNSFLIKGWTVTLVSAAFAIGLTADLPRVLLIVYLVTIVFWILDAYYLSQERKFRSLYDVVRLQNDDQIDFDMNTRQYNVGRNRWKRSFLSATLTIFYSSILILITVIKYLI